MTKSASSSADQVRQWLLQGAVSGDAGQEALERLYRHYDPLIRAALPKNLGPEDAEDLVMDIWAQVVGEIRQGRRLRRHEDVIALIAAAVRNVGPSELPTTPGRRAPTKFWARVMRFLRLLLPGEEPLG